MKLVLGSPDRYLQPIKLSLGEVEVSLQAREEVLGDGLNTCPQLDLQLGEPRARVKDETEAAAGASTRLVALVPLVNYVARHVEESRLAVETLANDPLDCLGLGVWTDPDNALPERVVGCDLLEPHRDLAEDIGEEIVVVLLPWLESRRHASELDDLEEQLVGERIERWLPRLTLTPSRHLSDFNERLF